MLGNAGGSTARALAALYPRSPIDGVEIDPAVTDAARRYLGLGRIPRLHVVTADARAYLRSTGKRYDADRDRRLPAAVHPVPGGDARVLRARALAPDAGRLRRAERRAPARTTAACSTRSRRPFANEFGQAWEWDALRFNSLLFACDGPCHARRARSTRRRGSGRRRRSLVPLFRRDVAASGFRGTVLTDDRAPRRVARPTARSSRTSRAAAGSRTTTCRPRRSC